MNAKGLRLYHGGVSGLRVGDSLLPPSVTGLASLHDETTSAIAELARRHGHTAEEMPSNPHRTDCVYLTSRKDLAFSYALGGGAERDSGAVYEAVPDGTVSPDPDFPTDPPVSFTCSAARIVRVHMARIDKSDQNARKAMAIMRRFMRDHGQDAEF